MDAAAVPGRFTVPSGVCAGEYDAVLISTDLEPDDGAALKALAPQLQGLPLLVVVGEGHTDGKPAMVASLLARYGLDAHATIIQGMRSTVPYPAAALVAFDDAAAPLPAATVLSTDTVQERGGVGRIVEDFLRAHTSPFALLLKPPHELLGLPADALRRASAAAYGSFNFVVLRDVARANGLAADEEAAFALQEGLLHSFRACLWVERSASVGRDASLDAEHAAALWPVLAADSHLMGLTRLWNETTIIKFGRALAALGDKVVEAFGASGAAAFDTVEKLSEQARGGAGRGGGSGRGAERGEHVAGSGTGEARWWRIGWAVLEQEWAEVA